MSGLGRDQPRADHGIPRHERCKLVLAHVLGARRLQRQHHEARFGRRIPHADARRRGKRDAEIGEHAARILDGAGAIGGGLVPDRRQAQNVPRVAGAERAHDHVVQVRRVLDHHEMVAHLLLEPEAGDGLVGVLQKGCLECGILPGLGNQARADVGADLGLVILDHHVERLGVEVALIGQHRFERAHPELQVRQLGHLAMMVVLMAVTVVVIGVIVVVARHARLVPLGCVAPG